MRPAAEASSPGEGRTAAHLRIPLEEYDARIATFIPHYDSALDQAAAVVAALGLADPVLLDLGIGTGALAERCLAALDAGAGRVVGIDTDPGMLELARARLAGTTPDLRVGSYLELELPACDIAISSFSFHHIREPEHKQALYRRLRTAVREGGALVVADCYLPASPVLADAGMRAWAAHLERSYPPAEARGYLDAWAEEDVYRPLRRELEWLAAAGFRPDVVWRRDLFAVLSCA